MGEEEREVCDMMSRSQSPWKKKQGQKKCQRQTGQNLSRTSREERAPLEEKPPVTINASLIASFGRWLSRIIIMVIMIINITNTS